MSYVKLIYHTGNEKVIPCAMFNDLCGNDMNFQYDLEYLIARIVVGVDYE